MTKLRGEGGKEIWDIRKREIERLMGVKIIKTLSGPEPTWSYRPGGEVHGFDSPENVIIELENIYIMNNLSNL